MFVQHLLVSYTMGQEIFALRFFVCVLKVMIDVIIIGHSKCCVQYFSSLLVIDENILMEKFPSLLYIVLVDALITRIGNTKSDELECTCVVKKVQ